MRSPSISPLKMTASSVQNLLSFCLTLKKHHQSHRPCPGCRSKVDVYDRISNDTGIIIIIMILRSEHRNQGSAVAGSTEQRKKGDRPAVDAERPKEVCSTFPRVCSNCVYRLCPGIWRGKACEFSWPSPRRPPSQIRFDKHCQDLVPPGGRHGRLEAKLRGTVRRAGQDSRSAPLHASVDFATPLLIKHKKALKSHLLSSSAVISGGFLVGRTANGADPAAVMLRRSQKDLVNDETRSSLINFLPSPASGGLAPQPFPTELRDVAAMVPSPSGKYLAVVRARAKDGKKEQSLEVWDGGSLVATVSGNGEMHGAVYAGDVFSSLEWDDKEERLMYVAERKTPDVSSFWQSKPAASPSWEGARWGGQQAEGKAGRGEEFKYTGDWGELCVGKSMSRLFVMHVPTGSIKQVPLRNLTCRPRTIFSSLCLLCILLTGGQ